MLITSLLNLSVSAQQINSLYILWQLDFNGSISTKIQNKNTLRKSDVSNCESHGLAVSMWACGTPWSQCFMIHTCSQDPFLLFQPLHHHGQEPTSCSNIQTVDNGPQQQAYWQLFGNGNGMRPQDLPHQVKMIMRKVADEPKTTWWSEGSWTTALSQ